MSSWSQLIQVIAGDPVLLILQVIKDTLKAFDGFKNKQKTIWINVFWHVKVCVFQKCIQWAMYLDKTQMSKKISSD